MRRKKLARWALVLTLCLSAVTLVGCEDENDPKTWVNKLSNDSKRAGATRRLRQLFESTMATTRPANNPRDAAVRRFLDTSLQPLVTVFVAHPDESIMREEAMVILAQSQDPRAIPALVSALNYRVGNADSERVALRAVQALKEMEQANQIPASERARVINSLVTLLDRAQGRSGNPQQIRYNTIQALGALRATEAVQPISALLTRNLAEQDIATARGACDALGLIGDARGVDAAIYGLYLNIGAQNAYNNCLQALGRIGAQHAVPRLIATLQGQNPQVERLIQQYSNLPNAPQPPPGLIKSTACDVLRVFASPDATQPLLAVLNNQQEPANVRAAAGEALAYTALANSSQRTEILSALTRVFNEGSPTDEAHPWGAPQMAARLALIGDPSSIPLLLGAVRHRGLASEDHAGIRVDLLLPFATIARHADVAAFQAEARTARQQIEHFIQENPDAEREGRSYLTALDRLENVIRVPRECNDGDLACYRRMLGDSNNDVVRKAAYMIAWTTPAAQQAEARQAILERITHPDVLVRRSLMTVLDAMSPSGCTECISRLEALIQSERGQESRILSHLDAQLLIGRLRARSGSTAAAAAH